MKAGNWTDLPNERGALLTDQLKLGGGVQIHGQRAHHLAAEPGSTSQSDMLDGRRWSHSRAKAAEHNGTAEGNAWA